MKNRDIVCLSTHYWDERRFRKQEFMSRFARSNRVLFVEPSFSMARRPELHLRQIATNRNFIPQIERRDDRLFLFKPPRAIPKWSLPQLEGLTYRWYSRLIGRAIERLGFRDVILWVYQPAYYDGLSAIPHQRLVFDLVDDLAAYHDGRSSRSENVERCVTGLVRRSDLLVATAKTLLDRYAADARNSVHVPNGFDAELFKDSTGPIPAQLLSLQRPILGFVGTLFEFLDFDLLEAVARAHSDKSLVLLGPVEAHARNAVVRLAQLPNVLHIEGQPQPDIPSFVAAFDVCLNPFRRSKAADSVNPLKVYEYLASGKPVVSTPMEALRREDAGRVIAFAASTPEFCRLIDECLAPDVQLAVRERQEAAAPYSWERLFARLNDACRAVLVPA